MTLLQNEFPLWVSVCAWCKPKTRGAASGNSPGAITHGICPRHLKKLKLELQMKKAGIHLDSPPAARSRRRKDVFDHPQLDYQAG